MGAEIHYHAHFEVSCCEKSEKHKGALTCRLVLCVRGLREQISNPKIRNSGRQFWAPKVAQNLWTAISDHRKRQQRNLNVWRKKSYRHRTSRSNRIEFWTWAYQTCTTGWTDLVRSFSVSFRRFWRRWVELIRFADVLGRHTSTHRIDRFTGLNL